MCLLVQFLEHPQAEAHEVMLGVATTVNQVRAVWRNSWLGEHALSDQKGPDYGNGH